ncbi:hypothetical protein TEA_028075 [Camellia sinensis var. sinensis]|uniref:R3H domain-containing protein n=1 Tax=Camellia sinensis var. sinensis TaxID=542762 RepID=A0A4S4EWA2_CAMSN|nr:hypothetical protein TEA_028075 [Camellia sinensis var. sinensis]
MMKLQVAPSSYSQKKKKQKSGGGQQQEQNPNVAESTRIRISQIIDQFLSTNDDMYAFEPNLTNAERAVVHELCRKLGLKSRSKGRAGHNMFAVYYIVLMDLSLCRNGNKRHVCVHKIKKNGFTKDGKENCSSFTFSEDAKEVLQDLFTQYPPDDRDLGEETIGKHGGKTEKIREKRDDIFCKPSMNKAEIGRKVESFASKLEKSQELRQITEGRAKLPIASFRDVIMSTIESNQVLYVPFA